jgi:hypothetical protein
MRAFRIGGLIAASAAILTTDARAQVEAVTFPVTEEVRVWRYSAPRVPLIGRVSSWTRDTLRLAQPPGPPATISTSDLARMEISRTKNHAGKGALIGAGIGAMAGFLAIATSDADAGDILGVTAFTAGGGAFWGVLIGLLIRTEEWEAVPMPSPGAGS